VRGFNNIDREKSVLGMQQLIRAKSTTEPLLCLSGIRCDGAIVPGRASVTTILTLSEIATNVVVPVQRVEANTRLRQITNPDWIRHLVVSTDLGLPSFYPPPILSARAAWYVEDSFVEVFDTAVLVDGAKRIEAALHLSVHIPIPVVIVFGLNPAEENQLRARISSDQLQGFRVEVRERIDTAAPRLTIQQSWIEVEIQSDPFVIPTARGYAPAIIIRRDNAAHAEHLLVGAASLARELEVIRIRNGTLRGQRVAVRKLGPERTDPYELRAL
jgi:hypothetical protein